MKNFISKHISFISIIILIVIWQLCGSLGLLPKFIFPTPLEIANAFVRDRALFLFHFRITMLEALIGLTFPSLSVQITILFKYFFNFNIYLMIF